MLSYSRAMTGEATTSLSPTARVGPAKASLLPLLDDAFAQLKVPSFIHVNLDAVAHNVDVLKGLSSSHTEIMGVVKGGAYGSGLLPVVEVLLEKGVKELSVATVAEGVYLRRHGIQVPITVLGNLLPCEVSDVTQHHLIPSLSWSHALTSLPREALVYPDGSRLKAAINIDTGMSRYGVQPEDLPALVQELDDLEVNIYSLYTHFQSAITEREKNRKQLDLFLEASKPFTSRGITRHVAATTGCVQDLGTDLDFIRPGGAITGLCSGSDREGTEQFAMKGFQPAFSVVTRPTFYKLLKAGRDIGYDGTYTTSEDEWIANFTTGWSDGLSRRLSNGVGAVKRVSTGERCPIVGRVSMDSITVRLPEEPSPGEVFQVLTDDFDDVTSAVGMARNLGGATYEMPGNWSTRLPRLYTRNGKIVRICPSLEYTC
ncbi:alanine racemase-like isoform X3 [Penaeus monodon]|uniref:alanine racemase-like isoform X3 n=1 Tax=Penaeus monodon TaxID=6687 RepID=UPI0018A71B13|nr:alanine racemase-like isoform X3 [Penaeus monodon]